jgi:hypothetical protein
MFVYCEGKVYRIPEIEHRYVSDANLNHWFNNAESIIIQKAIDIEEGGLMPWDKFRPFKDRTDLLRAIRIEAATARRQLTETLHKHERWGEFPDA